MPMFSRDRYLRAVGVVVLLAASGAGAGEATAPCQPKPLATLELHDSPHGPLVPMELEGRPVYLVLTTESTLTVLLEPALAHLGLEPVLIGNVTPAVARIAGERITHRSTVKSLRAGEYRYSPVVVGVYPGATGRRLLGVDPSTLVEVAGRPLVGEIGTEVLSRTDFELDLGSRALRLFSAKHCRDMGAYWTREYGQARYDSDHFGGLYFAMAVDGKLVETSISVDSATTSLDERIARDALGIDVDAPGGEAANEGLRQVTYRPVDLTLPGLPATGTRVRFVERSDPDCGQTVRNHSGARAIAYGRCLGIFPLVLGRDFSERFRFYFSRTEQKVYIGAGGPRSGEAEGSGAR